MVTSRSSVFMTEMLVARLLRDDCLQVSCLPPTVLVRSQRVQLGEQGPHLPGIGEQGEDTAGPVATVWLIPLELS